MKKRRFAGAVIVFALFCLVSPLYAYTPWLHTDGNKIKDPNGNVVVLRGVDTIDIGATEVWYGGLIATIDRVTNKSNAEGNSPGWYTKVIRLAIYPNNENSFTGGPKYYETDPNGYYTTFLRPVVDYCKTKDIYAIIDWHYVGDNTYDRIVETNAFWSFMAPKFAGDSHVLFELFNEPLNTSEGSEAANWARLKNDMQTWINIVRTSAPNNLILVGAPSWSQQIGPAASNPFSTSNPNNTNLVMVVHLYPGHWLVYGQDYFKSQVTTCLTRYPVFASEWGFWGTTEELLNGTITNYGQPLMDFYEQNKISHSAWCAAYAWNPPMFTSSWALRVGNAEMGGFVKDMLYAKRNSDQPGVPNDTIPPAAPTGLTATGGNSTVSLDWNDNNETDLAGYNAYRSTTSGGPYTKLNGSLLSTSNYNDNSVSGGTTYYYVVRAVDTSMNESGNSNQASATPTDTIPPAAPSGFSASAGNQTVALDWNNNGEPDINGYNIYRSTTSGGTYTRLNATLLTNSNYTDNSVTNGTTYYYVVTAVDTSSNESANSSQVSATPYIPTDVNILGSWVSGLSHTKETGSGRALVFIAHAEHTAVTSLNAVTYGGQSMTKVVDTIIGSGTRAYVAAYTLNEAGVAAATSNTFVATWSATPAAVGYASVFLKNANQTTLTGAYASNGVESATPNPITTSALSTSNGDMVIDAATCGNSGTYTLNSGFTEGIDQTMGGTATGVTGHKRATGASETPSATYSTTVNRQVIIGFVVKAPVNTAPAAPTGLTATSGNSTVSLNWNDNGESDLAGYNVYRSTTQGSGYVKQNSSLLTTSDYSDSNVSNGTAYYYVVTAVDTGTLESGYSSEVSATPNIPGAGTGAILREWWTDISGTAVSDLTSNVNYPDNSSGRELITKLEGPVNWADNYGASIRGFVIPPVSGSYIFSIAGADSGELWLSTDNNPANAALIAYVPGNPQSSSKSLVAGQEYYIEVLHKAGVGSDNISVSWQGPGISQQIIDGMYLSPCCLDFRDFADLGQQWQRSDCNAGNNWCSGQDRDRDGNVLIDDMKTFAEEWLTGL